MNNKILIGSIIAVVILILVSFTGVVGYQTTKSSTIAKASPLFTVRSNRAIDEESEDIACDYVGKGEESVLSIPNRDTQQYMIGKLINMIRNMDDRRFDKFVNRFIVYINQNKMDDVRFSNEEIEDVLFQMKNNPYVVKNSYTMLKEKDPPLATFSPPICIVFFFVLLIGLILLSPLLIPLGIIGHIRMSICIVLDMPYTIT